LIIVTALMAAVALTVAACAGSEEPSSAATGRTATSDSVTTTAAALDPEQLGEQIGAVYMGSVKDVAALLKARPEAAVVRPQIEQLRNDAITKLVEFGKAREAMSTADRTRVDAKIAAALSAAGLEEWYESYHDAWTHYSGVDGEFAALVASFNVIGQYANFDLLKEQLPEEAARLGIE
jgi:hypothetical protein